MTMTAIRQSLIKVRSMRDRQAFALAEPEH
jgi:hypothetical protein